MERCRARIMVADDEDSARGSISVFLKEEGYEVTVVPSGEEALEGIAARPYDLVITDIRMGGMGGLELLVKVKMLHPGTEVIIVTSYSSLEIAVLALRSGAYDYLIKPFEEPDLVSAAVSRAVERGNLIRERNALLEALERKNEELTAVNRILVEQASRDGLTGLYNHRYFQDALQLEASRAARNRRVYSLLFADIDNFKMYNDREGHIAGDTVLSDIGGIFRNSFRECDIVARYGGEEFVALLPETSLANAGIIADRVRGRIAGHPFPGREGQPGGALTVSLGLSSFPENGTDPVKLIRRADAGMYEAKKAGGNACRPAG